MSAFAELIKHVGRGEKGRRPLTQDEAHQAMQLFLKGEATLLQMAVLLMLQRVRCETAEEAAGYISALRQHLNPQWQQLPVDIDWPCFAGKRRQPPYLLLAAKLMAQQGHKVLLTGHSTVDLVKFQVVSACPHLNIGQAHDFASAKQLLEQDNIAYLPLTAYCPVMDELLALRSQVGLRTPLNTVARALNPAAAPFGIHGVFHQGYEKIHAQAAALVGDQNMICFKGEGGESERNPRTACRLWGVAEGEVFQQEWPTLLEGESGKHGDISGEFLAEMWQGTVSNNYGEHAVIATAALLIKQLNLVGSQAEAIDLSKDWWENRLRSS